MKWNEIKPPITQKEIVFWSTEIRKYKVNATHFLLWYWFFIKFVKQLTMIQMIDTYW